MAKASKTIVPKLGRPRTFATAQELLDAAYAYFAWADATPWKRMEALKKPYQKPKLGRNGRETKQLEWVYMVEVPTQRPYSLKAFGVYHAVSEQFILDLESRMKVAEKEGETEEARAEASDFLRVITHVRDVIQTQQLEGATVGAYNANIVARVLGLVDRKDMTTNNESMNKGFYELLKARRTQKQQGGNHG